MDKIKKPIFNEDFPCINKYRWSHTKKSRYTFDDLQDYIFTAYNNKCRVSLEYSKLEY